MKRALKIIFSTLLFLLLAFATFVYLVVTEDDSKYSSISPSGKYEFTMYESCMLYCEQYASIRRLKDYKSQHCDLGIRSESPIFSEGVSMKWSKDETKLSWESQDEHGTVDLKSSQNNVALSSPSLKNHITIIQKCLFNESCQYTFLYVTPRYDRSTRSDANTCPSINSEKAGELFTFSDDDLHWIMNEKVISYWYKGKNEILDLYRQCILPNYQPKKLDYLSKTSFRIFKKHQSKIPETPFMEVGFYPLGTSRDGKFAYMTPYPTGASDGFYWVTNVMDLETNKIIYKDEFLTKSESSKEVNVKKYWKQNGEKISEELKNFNISLTPSNHFTFTDNIQNYKWKYDTNKSMRGDYVESYNVYLEKDKIDKRNHKMLGHLLDAGVVGHFAVGYDYLAVIVAEVSENKKGTPSTLEYHVVGVSLRRY